MAVSSMELARARGVTAALLDELELKGYLFELDAFGRDWRLRLDCAIDEGWASMQLPVDRERLLACEQDDETREQLLADWRRRLQACRADPS